MANDKYCLETTFRLLNTEEEREILRAMKILAKKKHMSLNAVLKNAVLEWYNMDENSNIEQMIKSIISDTMSQSGISQMKLVEEQNELPIENKSKEDFSEGFQFDSDMDFDPDIAQIAFNFSNV